MTLSSSPPRRSLVAAVLCLVATIAPGCVRQQIESAREASARDLRAHLSTYSESQKTPEQAARAAALREKLLRDEWVQRGYRVGNDKAGPVVYSAAGMGPLRGPLYLLFALPHQMLAFAGGDNAARAVRLMQNERSADARRRGINDLLRWDFAQNGPYVKRYRQIARDDADPSVRATAIRALSRCRDPEARPTFIEALGDSSERVRLEAAKALVNLPDPAAAEPLVRIVSDANEDRDVRIAAAEALNHYRKIEVARALTSRLNERDFSVAWHARRSLRRLTGKDFRFDEAAWLEYIAGPDKPFG